MMKNPKAKEISRLINDCAYSPRVVGCELSTDHRYLQSEFSQTAIAFFGCLAENYDKGYYDERNEYVSRCARIMIDALKDADLYSEEFEGARRREILERLQY